MSTIVQIRGNSGSGKSTIVHDLLHSPHITAFRVNLLEREAQQLGGDKLAKRRQPIGYMCNPKSKSERAIKPFFILGHYESPCGGCDNISGYDTAYALIKKFGEDVNILYEGLLLSEEVNRAVALNDTGIHDYRTLHVDTPLDVCLSSINERRRRKNPDAPDGNPDNTTRRHKTIDRAIERLAKAGVKVQPGDRELTARRVRFALGITGE